MSGVTTKYAVEDVHGEAEVSAFRDPDEPHHVSVAIMDFTSKHSPAWVILSTGNARAFAEVLLRLADEADALTD